MQQGEQVRVSFIAAPGPYTRAQMVHELIGSTLYLKQQIPCPLRDIAAQVEGAAKGPTLRKYRQYIDALETIKEDLYSLFQNDQLRILEVQVLFGVSWTTPKDGVVLSFVECEPVINDETIEDMEDSKADAYARKLLRAAIPLVGGHTLAMNKMHVVVKAEADQELKCSGWHHRLGSFVLAKSAAKIRKPARNARLPTKIDLVAPTQAVMHNATPVHATTPAPGGFVLEIYEDTPGMKRHRSDHDTNEEDTLQHVHTTNFDEANGHSMMGQHLQLPQGHEEVVVWLHSRRGLRGLPS